MIRRLGWRNRSLRARLTAASTAVIALAIAGASILLVWRVHSTLISGLDATLSQRATDVAAEATNGQLAALGTTGADSATLVQVVGPGGNVVASSANINGEPAMFTFAAAPGRVIVRRVNAAGTDQGGYLVAAVSADSSTGRLTIYAARPTTDIDQSTTQLTTALLVGGPILIAMLGAVAWVLVGRALRPVEAMRRQVTAIPGTELHRRLPVTTPGDELGMLAATFNALLARIEDSADQQRRFLADAAHELRSPVASLHTQLDVRASHPQLQLSPDDVRQLAADTGRLAALVDSLLGLARLDAHIPLRHEPVDVDDLVLDQVRRAATSGGPRVDAAGVSAAQVLGDRAALARVVANLIDNAVRHATGVVTIDLHDDGTAVVLSVADDGHGIAPADHARVFERFTRLDDARSRDVGGAGLGLAIVRDIVAAHEGSVRIEDNRPGARFVVTLPRGPEPTA
ncbi:MAG: signal transduction histidine kinase [Pseudonocardiales bacterium]|nr:signal transduction histidine kinase [Pseudonocardiales bacterium]